MGVVMARFLPFLDWARHIQATYYENSDVPRWTLENPYANPLTRITYSLPESADYPHPDAAPWFAGGSLPQEVPWVMLEGSLQWEGFKRIVETLESRGNRVFVLVGPLNEHMLEPSSAEVYRRILREVEGWLKSRGLPYYIPSVLSSELYADLSHPFGEGYALLAEDLWEHLSSP